ncbi:MAG: DegV family protein [Clostridiales bacterium]|nr:DegV family protein [Clostridiales bacterium]
MKKRIIITDSASDISEELEKKLGIRILPFQLSVDGKSYTSRVDFSNEEFYTILDNAKSLPTTSQITPFEFVELYTELFKEGYEDVILVLINSKGSATFNNAKNSVETFIEETPEAKGKINIYPIDGRSYSGGYGLPVILAAEKLNAGEDTKKIVSYLEDYMSRSLIYAGLYTLKYAGKSGRISGAAAFVGDVLGLKPLMRICDNEITTKEKVRGEKKIIPGVLDKIAAEMEPNAEYFVVCGNNPEDGKIMAEEAEKRFGYPPVDIFRIGAAIAINAGPKVVGVGTIRKK